MRTSGIMHEVSSCRSRSESLGDGFRFASLLVRAEALHAFTAPRLWLLVALAGAALAHARPAAADAMHRSPHMEETSNIVGLKGGVVGAFHQGESAVGGGLSPFYERNLIPGWLELETAMAVIWIEKETVVAFDVFAKKPFHVNEVVNPYVGLGPNVTIILGPEETRTRFGILGTVGSYVWFGKHRWGLDVEVVYLLLFNAGVTHELTVEAGPSFRF